jgi:hypothetical protein
MRRHRRLLGLLTIGVSGTLLAVSGFFALLLFEHTHIFVPLMVVAVLCIAVLVATVKVMRNGRP